MDEKDTMKNDSDETQTTENREENPTKETVKGVNDAIKDINKQEPDNESKETITDNVKNKRKMFSFMANKKHLKIKEIKFGKPKLSKKSYIYIAVGAAVIVAIYLGLSLQNYMSRSTVQQAKIPNTINKIPVHKIIAKTTPVNATNVTNATNATSANFISTHNIIKTANNIVPVNSKKAFDVFSLEPSQEYKLDQVQNIYKKSLEILKLQEEILKTKSKIDKIGQPIVTNESKKSSSLPVIAPPTTAPPPITKSSATVPFPTTNSTSFTLPKPPSFGNNNFGSSPSMQGSASSANVLSKVSINLIYNFKGNKMAVVQYGSSIFRASAGDTVAPGYRITKIKNSGIYVSGPEGTAFLPLAFRSSSNKIYFTKDSHSQEGNTGTSGFHPSSNFVPPNNSNANPIFSPQKNMSVPPANFGGIR